MQKGYGRVRPLSGGIEAWMNAGYTVETETATFAKKLSTCEAI